MKIDVTWYFRLVPKQHCDCMVTAWVRNRAGTNIYGAWQCGEAWWGQRKRQVAQTEFKWKFSSLKTKMGATLSCTPKLRLVWVSEAALH